MFTICIIFIIISAVCYIFNKEITTKEFLILVLSIVLTSGICYILCKIPYPNDIYFTSGKIISVSFNPEFTEEYEQSHTVCHSCGKSTCCSTYYTTEYQKYPNQWIATDSLNQEWEISKNFYDLVRKDFGNKVIRTKPYKCLNGGKIVSGDPYVYTYNNMTNTYNYPTNKVEIWANPLKGQNTIFNSKVDYKKEYPKSISCLETNRVQIKNINKKQWDILNTKVYEAVQANLIILPIDNSEEANKIESAWTNGKKNDLVICVKGDIKNPEYVKVFGWTKSYRVKRELEQYILDNGIVNNNDYNNILAIVVKFYEPYEMSKFDYIKKRITLPEIIASIIIVVIIFGCLYNFVTKNYDYRE